MLSGGSFGWLNGRFQVRFFWQLDYYSVGLRVCVRLHALRVCEWQVFTISKHTLLWHYYNDYCSRIQLLPDWHSKCFLDFTVRV